MGKQSWLIIDVAKNNPLVPFLSILKQFASRIPQIFIISPNDTSFNTNELFTKWNRKKWISSFHDHSLTQDIPATNFEHQNCHSFSGFLYQNNNNGKKIDARMAWVGWNIDFVRSHFGKM